MIKKQQRHKITRKGEEKKDKKTDLLTKAEINTLFAVIFYVLCLNLIHPLVITTKRISF